MRQAVVFPLNVIHSTAVIERSKLPLETFELKSLLEEISLLFENVVFELMESVLECGSGGNRGESDNDGTHSNKDFVVESFSNIYSEDERKLLA